MSWDSFWAYFKISTNEIKAAIWKELDLVHHLKGVSSSVQEEILKDAPQDVLMLVKNHISLDATTKLGVRSEQKSNQRVIRMIL